MLVKVEAATPGADAADLSRTLGGHLRENLGVRLETEVLPTGALPRYELKTRRIFDSRSVDERPVVTLGGNL